MTGGGTGRLLSYKTVNIKRLTYRTDLGSNQYYFGKCPVCISLINLSVL